MDEQCRDGNSKKDGPGGVSARERKGHQLTLVAELCEKDHCEGQGKRFHGVLRWAGIS